MADDKTLRTALLANAAFSGVCAVLMVFQPSLIGGLLGFEAALSFRLLGVGLLLFAIDLIHQATRPALVRWRAILASTGDLLWVLASAVGLILFANHLSQAGIVAILAVAAIVLGFGCWQVVGLRRLSPPNAMD